MSAQASASTATGSMGPAARVQDSSGVRFGIRGKLLAGFGAVLLLTLLMFGLGIYPEPVIALIQLAGLPAH